ncbi:MAG: hypothetical protein ACSHX3_14580 [Litorimonas sp.]
MARAFDLLVVCHIEMALAERHLEELERKGQPCPNPHAEAVAEISTGVADCIIAEADALPQEFKPKSCGKLRIADTRGQSRLKMCASR